MARFIRQGQFDTRIRLLTESLLGDLHSHDFLSEYAAILNWVRVNIRYSRDPRTIEQVKQPHAVVDTGTGDCMTLNTRVIVRDSEGLYRIRSLGELRDTYALYEALSYNFDARCWEFKPITAWADKETQEVYRVHLANGYSFTCTSHHKVFLWKQRAGTWEARELAEACASKPLADGSFKLKQGWTFLAARQIPALDRPTALSSDELAWLAGAYIADGWSEDGGKACISRSGPSQREITSRLERPGLPFAPVGARPGVGGGYARLHAHPMRKFFHKFGARALEKHIPEELLSGPLHSLSVLFDGYTWGDPWRPRPDKEYASHLGHVFMHSTVSHQLAEQLKFLYLLFGRPLSGGNKIVENHGGLGRNPIYRLWEAKGGRYQERMPGLTNIGTQKIEYAGTEPVCDISVADNRNFVLSNGVVVHNCDDMAVLLGAMVGQMGGQVRLVAGGFLGAALHPKTGKPLLSHVWLEAYAPAEKAWVVLDPVPGRKVHQMIGRLGHVHVMPVVM